MRLRASLPLLVLVLLVIGLFILVSHVLAFVQIFFQHAGIAITQEEIAAAHVAASHVTGDPDLRPQLIPKIVHHIFHNWHNVSMPEHWEETRQTCMDTNKDWEYMVSVRDLPFACSLQRPMSTLSRRARTGVKEKFY